MAHRNNPFSGPAPILLILALLVGAAAWGLDHYLLQQTHRQADQRARDVSAALAGSLAALVAEDRQRLERLAGTDRVGRALAAGDLDAGEWQDGGRLVLVPDGAPVQDLSFVFQDLLRRLHQDGETTLSSQGGRQPSLLLARSAPGGALILEHRLDAWLADAAARLPPDAALSLEQDGLTLARRGQPRDGVPRAEARGGPFNLTLTVPPRPPLWEGVLVPGAAGLGLALLVAALALTVLRRRPGRTGTAKPAKRAPKPARKPRPATAGASVPSEPAPRPDPEPAPASNPAPEPGPTLPASLFRDHELGGPAMDAEALRHLGHAIGSEAGDAGQHTLFLAGDTRIPDALMQALLDGLLASGRQVLELGRVPRPLMYYATEVLESQSGLYLAGHPDQPEGAGLEVRLKGEPLHGPALTALGERLSTGRLTRGEGQREQRDPGERYVRDLSDDIILARPMKVVVDAGHGTTGALAPALLKELGCSVVALRGEPRANAAEPPTGPDTSVLRQAVTEQNADLGLALNGDGTRLAVVAGDGAAVSTDRVLMVLARDLLSRNPGSDVLFDVECSRALATLIRKQGGRPIMDRTGSAALKARLKETGAPLAGGISGHICFADRWFGFDDGLYAAARLLEILSLQSGTSGEVFTALETGVATPELRIPVDGSRKVGLMEALTARAGRFPGGRPVTVDGLRVDFPDGWGLVRAARTAPALAARFEGRDTQALERVQALFREQLLAVDADLELPF